MVPEGPPHQSDYRGSLHQGIPSLAGHHTIRILRGGQRPWGSDYQCGASPGADRTRRRGRARVAGAHHGEVTAVQGGDLGDPEAFAASTSAHLTSTVPLESIRLGNTMVSDRPLIAIARGVDGRRYEVRAEPAPKARWYRSEGLRWWRSLVRDGSWWVTVTPVDGTFAVLKESYRDGSLARARFSDLTAFTDNQTFRPKSRLLLIRRRHQAQP